MVNLQGLNDRQLEAVLNIHGVIQVLSVAGSGKTRVLTERVNYMLNERNINPKNIFVATFTKKASEEMTERLSKKLDQKQLNALTIGTFHSIGYHILKDEYKKLNHPLKGFQLINGAPVKILVSEILNDLNIYDADGNLASIFVSEINNLKLNLISPDQYMVNFLIGFPSDRERDLYYVYNEYEKRKEARKLIDFNDMLFQVYHLFLQHPDILEKYQNKFKFILVDEAQDNNKVQYELIKMLAEKHRNLFIVGDDDQSIYGFRGARPDEFINFKNEFPELMMVNMEQNYRSQPAILATANNLIKYNEKRIVKELKPFRQGNINPVFFRESDEDCEAENIARKILKLNKDNKSFKDMAIIYRMNSQSRALEDHLLKNGIPYVIIGGISFYERAEIKDLIAYLRLVNNTLDDESLKRIINVPNRYLGKAFMDELQTTAQNRRISLYEALGYVYGRKNNIEQFKTAISDTKRMISRHAYEDVGNIIKYIRNAVNYDAYLRKENGNEEDNIRLENVASLERAASNFTNVKEFLNYIDKTISNKNNEKPDAVRLMTIHKSKGLEFPIVFMAGVSESILPHYKAMEDNNVEEERRLAYVGITRAENELYVSGIASYQGKLHDISRFISEAQLDKFEEEEPNAMFDMAY